MGNERARRGGPITPMLHDDGSCWACGGRGYWCISSGGGEMCGLCRQMLTYTDEQVADLYALSILPCGHRFTYAVALHRYQVCSICAGNHGAVTEATCADLAEAERNDPSQW